MSRRTLKKKFAVGDRVALAGGPLAGKKGTVLFFGDVPRKTVKYVGVELDEALGKHDGKPASSRVRYFRCKHKHGYMAVFTKFRKLKKKGALNTEESAKRKSKRKTTSPSAARGTDSKPKKRRKKPSKKTGADAEDASSECKSPKEEESTTDDANASGIELKSETVSEKSASAASVAAHGSAEGSAVAAEPSDGSSGVVLNDTGAESIELTEAQKLLAQSQKQKMENNLMETDAKSQREMAGVSEQLLQIHEREMRNLREELGSCRQKIGELSESVVELEEVIEMKEIDHLDVSERMEALSDNCELWKTKCELLDLEMEDLRETTAVSKLQWLESLDDASSETATIVAQNEALTHALTTLRQTVARTLSAKEEELIESELRLRKAQAMCKRLTVIPSLEKECANLRLTNEELRHELSARFDMDELIEALSERNLELEGEVLEGKRRMNAVAEERDSLLQVCDESDLLVCELNLALKESSHCSAALDSELHKATDSAEKCHEAVVEAKAELLKEREKVAMLSDTGRSELIAVLAENRSLHTRVLTMSGRLRGLGKLSCSGVAAALKTALWRWHVSAETLSELQPSLFDFLSLLTALRLKVDLAYEWLMTSFVTLEEDEAIKRGVVGVVARGSDELNDDLRLGVHLIVALVIKHSHQLEIMCRGLLCLSLKDTSVLLSGAKATVALRRVSGLCDAILALDASDNAHSLSKLRDSAPRHSGTSLRSQLQESSGKLKDVITGVMSRPKAMKACVATPKATSYCDRFFMFELLSAIRFAMGDAIQVWSPRIHLLIAKIKGEVSSTATSVPATTTVPMTVITTITSTIAEKTDSIFSADSTTTTESSGVVDSAMGARRQVLTGVLQKMDSQLRGIHDCVVAAIKDCTPVRASWCGPLSDFENVVNDNATAVQFASVSRCRALLRNILAAFETLHKALLKVDRNLALFERIGAINHVLDSQSEMNADSLLNHLDTLSLTLRPVRLLLERSADPSNSGSPTALSDSLLAQVSEWDDFQFDAKGMAKAIVEANEEKRRQRESSRGLDDVKEDAIRKLGIGEVVIGSELLQSEVERESAKLNAVLLAPVWFEKAKRVRIELKSHDTVRHRVMQLQQMLKDSECESALVSMESAKVRDCLEVVKLQLFKSQRSVQTLTQYELRAKLLVVEMDRLRLGNSKLNQSLTVARNQVLDLERTVNMYKDQQFRQRVDPSSMVSTMIPKSAGSTPRSMSERLRKAQSASQVYSRGSKSSTSASSLRELVANSPLTESASKTTVGSGRRKRSLSPTKAMSLACLPTTGGGASNYGDSVPRLSDSRGAATYGPGSGSLSGLRRDITTLLSADDSDSDSLFGVDTATDGDGSGVDWAVATRFVEVGAAAAEHFEGDYQSRCRLLESVVTSLRHSLAQIRGRRMRESVLSVLRPLAVPHIGDIHPHDSDNEEYDFTDSEEENEMQAEMKKPPRKRRRKKKAFVATESSEGLRQNLKVLKCRFHSLWAAPRVVDLTQATVATDAIEDMTARALEIRSCQVQAVKCIESAEADESAVAKKREGFTVSFPVAKISLPRELALDTTKALDIRVTNEELTQLCDTLMRNAV